MKKKDSKYIYFLVFNNFIIYMITLKILIFKYNINLFWKILSAGKNMSKAQ